MTKSADSRPWWRRLRVRISIRTLLVLVLLVGGGLGWIVNSARIQRLAVESIRKNSGLVVYS